MNYIFNGNLKGFYCEDCYDYLNKARIKIYEIDTQAAVNALTVAGENETFYQQSDDELKLLSNRLLFETETDESGNFTVSLSDTQKYNGGAFEIDFDCGCIPVYFGTRPLPKPHEPVKFHITALQPLWKEIPGKVQTVSAHWQYGIINKFCW
jgi:hypothetical protein